MVIEAGCSAEHMRGLRGRRLCSSFLVQRCMFSHGVCSRFSVVFTVSGTQFKSSGKESKTFFFESFRVQKIIFLEI